MLTLDHLVVVAPDLAEGVAHVHDCLGLAMPEGGHHRQMGTRNHLLRLGDAIFLEVIAVDPEAPASPHARWFGLSDPTKVRADWDSGRRLRGFVVRTDDLDGVLAAHPDLLGQAATMTRGALSWRFGLRPDGAWLADGAAPCVMAWGQSGNPARTMPDLGAQLDALVLTHPDPDAARQLHTALGLAEPPEIIQGDGPRWTARITTPSGSRTLT
ncbi:Glyoxalase-like domain-containing protein [Methylobacterium phyllostachyos]|uniref:Glyoxalase-like domain-containing protein n=1 Tax=Methylobacterium phyllostachyos TaxID=582672 RepID=A0A1G9RAI0_9HYPH|nr:VOC family protein [Methylobacterium phyllostachyos]SDM20332.1 Glyoxalase-like domain-containing protein [Methylobacterium phyllostachyos]